MSLAEDQHVIKALVAKCPHKSFPLMSSHQTWGCTAVPPVPGYVLTLAERAVVTRPVPEFSFASAHAAPVG